MLAVFALLAGTATTFSVATPLMATIIVELFHVAVSRTVINIIILLITCAVYTYSLLHGFKGISKLANICIYMFFGLIAFVLLFGGKQGILSKRFFFSWSNDSEFYRIINLYRSAAYIQFSSDMDDLLLGVLDGMVCSSPFFIGSISRDELCVRLFWAVICLVWLYADKFYCIRKLFNGYAVEW